MAKKKEAQVQPEEIIIEEKVVEEKPKESKYTREAILASPEFKGYQPDFLAALLTKPQYTLAEARKVASAFKNVKEN